MNILTQPTTNMEIADRINSRQPLNNAPYYDQEIHDYLINKGAEFEQMAEYLLCYRFRLLNAELMRLLFYTDLDRGQVKIQYFYQEDGDEHLLPVAEWLTDVVFSIPTGVNALAKFCQILNAYIDSL